ncbi:MAG TPA: condensation domain-containing protein [Terracidiphilus sp.]|nr:condensation domain-containing protein [Terracidiphilus sp.]
MTTLPLSAPPNIQPKLRPLSGLERLFWALDKIHGFNFAIAVSFRGTIAHSRWKDAFVRAQKRHPLLDAGINEDDPCAPYLMRGAGFPIPVAFQCRASSTQWQRVMESEIAEPFDLSAGPLLRAAIVEDEQGCDLVLIANHTIVDGMGILAFLRDLLDTLAGQTLADLPLPLSSEDRATAMRSSNSLPAPLDGDAAEPQPRNRTYAARNRKGKPAISALRLSQEQTARLQRYARREQTTIGAVLTAAAASAWRDLSPQWKQADLRLTTALDARPYLGNEKDFVLSIISPRAIVPYPEQDLAASARAIKSQIAPFQSFLAIEATFRRIEAVHALKLDAATLVNMLAQGFGHDLGVSNLKTVELPVQPEGLQVESVWGPSVLCGYENEHFIGCATYDAALHLVYSSYTPLSGLLEAVHEKLSAACSDA